jgi:hypothetical protein
MARVPVGSAFVPASMPQLPGATGLVEIIS